MSRKAFRAECPCGAKVEIIDNTGTYINAGGRPDVRGRVYICEVRFDEWMDRHQPCVDTKIGLDLMDG